MNKPEVQALVAFVLTILDVVFLFLNRHGIPLLVSVSVPQDVIQLRCQAHSKSTKGNSNQLRITSLVQRCIILSIYVGCYDSSRLRKHVH